MSDVRTIGLDLAKNVFQIHGADETGAVVFRKQLRRGQVLKFFSGLQQCVVAMEACGSSHFWAREIGRLGHEVRMIPPAYVKPFVKRQKNDMADAEAICEAAQCAATIKVRHSVNQDETRRRSYTPAAAQFIDVL